MNRVRLRFSPAILVFILILPVLVACGSAAGEAPGGDGETGTGGETPTTSGSPGSDGSGEKGTIKLVSSWPLTGQTQKLGQDMVKSVEMAIEDHGGTAGGFTIEYEPLDDATAAKGSWDAAKEAENANKAAADADVMAYIATYNSGAAKIAIPILNEAGLAMISPANTYPGLTKKIEGLVEADEPDVYYPNGERTYCRVVPSDEIQGAVAAQWAKELGAQKVYVLDDTELYGRGVALVFAQKAEELGMEVLGHESINPKQPDYRAVMSAIRAEEPDLIYFGGITDNNAGKLVQDMRAVGMTDTMFMGPDGLFNDGFIEAAGSAAENAYTTFGGIPPAQLTGKGAEWYTRFKEKYNQEPDAYAVYAYEAASVVLEAIDSVGEKDRQAILEAIRSTTDFDGLLGTWSFTETCDTTLATMSGNQVKNGSWEYVGTLELQE